MNQQSTYKNSVVICIGRKFRAENEHWNRLDNILRNLEGKTRIVALETDRFAIAYAEQRGYRVEIYNPDWDRYGRAAGYRCNELMAKVATHVIAIWDGVSPSPKHMIDLATQKRLPVRVIKYGLATTGKRDVTAKYFTRNGVPGARRVIKPDVEIVQPDIKKTKGYAHESERIGFTVPVEPKIATPELLGRGQSDQNQTLYAPTTKFGSHVVFASDWQLLHTGDFSSCCRFKSQNKDLLHGEMHIRGTKTYLHHVNAEWFDASIAVPEPAKKRQWRTE